MVSDTPGVYHLSAELGVNRKTVEAALRQLEHEGIHWCTPAISHIQWDSSPLVRRIVRWASSISQGRIDLGQTNTPARFITGGTTGPAPA